MEDYTFRNVNKKYNWTLTKVLPPQDMWPDYDLIWARFIGWLHTKFNINIGYWAEEAAWEKVKVEKKLAQDNTTDKTESSTDEIAEIDDEELEEYGEDYFDEDDYGLRFGCGYYGAEYGDYISNESWTPAKMPKGGIVVGKIHDSFYCTVCYKILCTDYEGDNPIKPKVLRRYFDYMMPSEVTFHEPAGHISYVEHYGYKLRPRFYRDGWKIGFVKMYYSREMRDWIYD